jgi:hypothetical protein
MAGSGGRSKKRFFTQPAQAQLELLLVRQTLGCLPSRMKPAQQVMRKSNPNLVFCDLRGYTAFTETTEPEEVLDLPCASTTAH